MTKMYPMNPEEQAQYKDLILRKVALATTHHHRLIFRDFRNGRTVAPPTATINDALQVLKDGAEIDRDLLKLLTTVAKRLKEENDNG